MAENSTDEPFERVGAGKGRELFDDEGIKWIDVREPAEWQQMRIPGAVLIPLNRLLMSPRQYLQGDGVVFYCAQGVRSAVACEVAAAVGLHQIYNLEGGIQEWVARGYPVER
jgi:adenylyltransferase/sulfurtransferase